MAFAPFFQFVTSQKWSAMESGLSAIFFGLSASASWGAADFSGGVATKNNSVYKVIIIAQIIGGLLLFALAALFQEQVSSIQTIIWGIVGGCAGSIGLVALYQGLAVGRMGIVAPLTALLSGILPVIVGMALEGLPTFQQFVGFAIALVAVWLISSSSKDFTVQLRDLTYPVIAGLGFGFFFVAIDQMSEEAVFLPLVAARIASIFLLLLIFFLTQRRKATQSNLSLRSQLPIIALAGILDTAGNTFFALATQSGRLDMASILGSLYPAVTVLLAWILLKEVISRRQWVGVSGALVAVMLITI